MSCWHDPRGREIVDGYGKALRDGDEVRRARPSKRPPVGSSLWYMVQFQSVCWHACKCGGYVPALKPYGWPVRPASAMVPHSCRPERHR